MNQTRKKIVYIGNSRIPTEKAHGLQITRMCEAFAQNGTDVTLLIPRRKNYLQEDLFSYYGVHENKESSFNVVYLPIVDLIGIKKIGFFLNLVQFLFVATFYVLFKKFDLIFTREEWIASHFCLLGKKVFWESHRGSWNFFSRFASKLAHKIIVISGGLHDFYLSKGVPKNKLCVFHDGVRLEDYMGSETKNELIEMLDLPKGPLVVCNSSLYKWKGVYTLANVARNLKDIHFVFIGGKPADVEAFKEIYKDSTNIILLGYKKNAEIPNYLKAADLLALTNSGKTLISSSYTSPMKLFEYMASGVPIISSDLPSMRDVLTEETALFFEADNEEDLSQKIQSYFENKENYKKLGSAAQKEVLRYSWKQRAKDIIDLLST